MTDKETSYCVDCEHFAFERAPRCKRPVKEVSVVWGERMELDRHAEQERKNMAGCGPAGRFYRAKKPGLIKRLFLALRRNSWHYDRD